MNENKLMEYDLFLFEEAMNELMISSAGIKELLSVIYQNWEKLRSDIKKEMGFSNFKDVVSFIKTGDREDQDELEDWVKSKGYQIG